MLLDPPTYLGSLQGNIRQRPIPWDGAVRAGTLTEDQLARIRAVDKVKRDVRKQTIEADLDGYRILFVGDSGTKSVLESAHKRGDVVQYILVLLSDLLAGTPGRFPPLSTLPAQPDTNPMGPQTFPRCPKPSSGAAIPIATSCLSSRTPPTLKTRFPS
jgi:hypothetical protein